MNPYELHELLSTSKIESVRFYGKDKSVIEMYRPGVNRPISDTHKFVSLTFIDRRKGITIEEKTQKEVDKIKEMFRIEREKRKMREDQARKIKF